MAHKWADVRGKFSDEEERTLQLRYEEEVKKLSLHQVRHARSLTQVNLANTLHVNQGTVSKLEKRTDMYVSTLRSYIEAMGGQLQIRAIFPDGEVQIEQFHELAQKVG
jgi:DNA-binding XRE family transcriptional regulator